MDHFNYRDGELHCEDTPISEIVESVGTPAYIYSKQTFLDHFQAISQAFSELDPIVCYSIKSCGNLHIVKLLASQGSGMDVVSGGEVFRAQQSGVDMSKVVYAGVGKTDEEIEQAIRAEIGWFNIESEAEFENIAAIAARLGKEAHGALRINPDVADARTHAKTTTGSKETKFGVDIERAKRFFHTYGKNEHCRLDAIHLHIGSPIYSPEPYVKAITKTLEIIEELRADGFTINTIDIGGGYAADYETGASPSYKEYADAIVPLLKPFKDAGGTVILEPGRTIAANAGVLVTEVQYIKQGGAKKFVICDTGMHHLIRPTLYEAWQFIWPTKVAPEFVPDKRAKDLAIDGLEVSEIVGPICETGDYLAKDRPIPPVDRGDLLAVFSAGAYGMVMASHYNAMPNPPEVMVGGDAFLTIRRRETYEDLVAAERV
ncbi:MAG: diaminopimelate decarboxylase [Phycisphaeraceae bacterium]|nr:diaminopimelate decarboxylase [Phycisphaeraceae bacterium]